MKFNLIWVLCLAFCPIAANSALAYYYGFAKRDNVSILKNPGGQVLCQANKNDRLRMIPVGEDNQWHATDYCGQQGWIHQTNFVYQIKK